MDNETNNRSYVVYKGKYWSGNIDLKIVNRKVRVTSMSKI